MPSCSAIDFAEIRRSFKISSWIWSIISRMVNVLCRPGRGASQVEKSPCLNGATQFLTVAYDGACSPNVSIRMAWISFGVLPYRKKKDLMTARVWILFKSRAWHAFFEPLQQEKSCNSAQEQTPHSIDTIDSVLRHREVIRAKDLLAPPLIRSHISFAFAKLRKVTLVWSFLSICSSVLPLGATWLQLDGSSENFHINVFS